MYFEKELNSLDDKTRTYYETDEKGDKNIKFDPPVYEQRYIKTVHCLQQFDDKIKRVVEFGCAELKFFTYLKHGLPHATKLDFVDIDEELISRFHPRVDPLLCDHIGKRETELEVNVWKGNVAIPNPSFEDVDAVVAIELIEHVFPDVLEEVPFHIFAVIRPKVAVLTTPNGDFNVLFNLEPLHFRHYDHKFEWTRAEFEDWCHHICMRFPEYYVQFHGIGNPPKGSEKLGFVSQMGFFIRKDFIESFMNADNESIEGDNKAVNEESQDESAEVTVECADYKLIHTVKYPFFRDMRSRGEKILDECKYQVQRLQSEDEFFNSEKNRFEIPLEMVASCCWHVSEDFAEISGIVKQNFETEEAFVILPPFEESECEDDYYNQEDDYYNNEDQTPAREGDVKPAFQEDWNAACDDWN